MRQYLKIDTVTGVGGITGLLRASETLGCVGVADGRIVERIDGATRAARERVAIGLQGEGGGSGGRAALDVREE